MRQLDNKAIGVNPNFFNEENLVFTHFRLIFYCYLLIPINELRVKLLKFNNLKNEKK